MSYQDRPELQAAWVIQARVNELESEGDTLRRELAMSRMRHARAQRFIDVLEPVALMYVKAFDEDEMMTLPERLRLQAVEDTLDEIKILREADSDV